MNRYECYLKAKELLNNPPLMAQFILELKAKGETADELSGLIDAVKEQSIKVDAGRVLDIVGTGGDGLGTVNISTGSALLAAACGVRVLKHGNRSVSSLCGSADVLEAMGIPIHLGPDLVKRSVETENFGFCFAPDYHPAFAAMREVRKALKVPTAFNLMGPLLNPAGIDYMMIGVYDPKLVPLMADTLFKLGTKRSLVFHGHGIDELSCLGPTNAILVTDIGQEAMQIDPVKLGLKLCTLQDLKGGDAKHNAKILQDALSRKGTSVDDTLILNAAAAMFLYDGRPLEEGVKIARLKLKNLLQDILLRKKKPARPRRSLLKAVLQKHAVIGEIKRASPSKGKIASLDPVSKAKEYEAGGAAAISVLTDEGFEGSFADMRAVSEAVSLPVLCKDFLICPEQIAEAAKEGADAVLLIVAALREETAKMVQVTHLFGLEALVEVHTLEEVKIALEANADLIAVNQRDLTDFSMHGEVFEKLAPHIPAIKVAASGIHRPEDAKRAFELGYNAILVGEALSKASDAKTLLESFRCL